MADSASSETRQCPGDKYTIDASICRARQARRYEKCTNCQWQEADASASGGDREDPRSKVFKAYDIRGIYPRELDERLAERIGMATTRFLNARELVVGRDMRESSESLAAAAIQGALTSGADVLDIGMVSTDACYFAIAHYGQDGGIMTTASHNPPEYNGFKISREKAIPVGAETGLQNIQRIALGPPIRPSERRGHLVNRDVLTDFAKHVLKFQREIKPLKVVIDAGNGMAGHMLPPILEALPVNVTPLYFTPDGSFPNHEANPLKVENMRDLQQAVRETGADLGVAFDGDADRCAFVDDNGEIVSCDLTTVLIAAALLKRHKKATILYDVRSSWVVPEEVRKLGGKPLQERVGHSFMKATMRKQEALFGGELSGHFYFRDNSYADSGAIAMIEVLNALSEADKPLSELLIPLRRYHATGELNFEVDDKKAKMQELIEVFKDGKLNTLDGVTIEYDDWWFNVRPSNTESLLRLNLEAKTAELMEERREHVAEIIQG